MLGHKSDITGGVCPPTLIGSRDSVERKSEFYAKGYGLRYFYT